MSSARLLLVRSVRPFSNAVSHQISCRRCLLPSSSAALPRPTRVLGVADDYRLSSVRFFRRGGGGGYDDDSHDDSGLFVEPLSAAEEKELEAIKQETTKVPAVVPAIDSKDDPFGVLLADEDEKSENLPPLYKRDATTGRLTGEIEQELNDEQRRVLKADPVERDRQLLQRVERHWRESGTDPSGLPAEIDQLGESVRRSDMALNVIGRSTRAQATQEVLEDGSTLGRDVARLSQPLTPKEFETMKAFMKKMHMKEVSEDDIPVMSSGKYVGPHDDGSAEKDDRIDPDEINLSLKWLTARAQREMDDLIDDNPYADLVPQDLSPTRLVNRKRAKPIPRELMHHNNIDLLKSFMTTTGQIQSRVQTRLGARDQRKVAKLIKRARSLGLIPYQGQFKAEQHGWVHAEDIRQNREWEEELVRRGLVIKRSTANQKKDLE